MPLWLRRRQPLILLGLSFLLAVLWPVSWGMADNTPLQRVDLILLTDNQTIIIDAEIVDTPRKRAKGLMFREDLTEGQGMVFVFSKEARRSFWMKNTPLSLDILFFDAKGQFVNGHYHTTPFSKDSLRSDRPAQYAVEILAGEAKRLGLSDQTVLKLPFDQ